MANPSQKKEVLLAEAAALDIDVDALEHEEGKEPTNQTLADAINVRAEELAAAQQEQPVDVNVFLAVEPGQTVPLAGLLAAEPDLRDAKLTPADWNKKLATYLKSDRP